MDYVAACAVALLLGIAVGYALNRWANKLRRSGLQNEADGILEQARRDADNLIAQARTQAKEAEQQAKDAIFQKREEFNQEITTVRSELKEQERRIEKREEALDQQQQALLKKERVVDKFKKELAERREVYSRKLKEAEELAAKQTEKLLEISGLSREQASRQIFDRLEEELSSELGQRIQRHEEAIKVKAEERARTIIATAVQRYAAAHTADTTVSTVDIPNDEMKGRIIGREGRNIRTLETLTGIDFIIDDTPGAVLLSGFDGVRREIARQTLEKLLQDGRIHPARIEEAYHQAKSEIDQHVVEIGEQAVFEANVGSLHPELVKLLGKLRFRTSYGQNVLAHSIECARLASMLAAELGGDPRVAARAALLHDIGKAVSHETEGPHALVGGELARRYKESEAVAHAMEAHHNEVELQTVEAVIVQIVDSLSGARPGARGESLEHYVKRLHELEAIAGRHAGVDKVYAMHAGREIRVIVHPEEIDDDGATLLSHEIAREVEKQLEYPGQIKVTVIRESRATDYAK
jgi:ribonucrease Y